VTRGLDDELSAIPAAPSAHPTPTSPGGGNDAGSATTADTAHRLGRRNERILLWAIGGYIVLLSALMLARGISITPDVLLVALGLAAVLLGRGRLYVRDWVPFIGLFFAYELMRGYADNFGAGVHVTDVIAAERFISFGALPTEVLQGWLHPASGPDLLAVVGTIFYFLHFPLPIALGFFLWWRQRRVYYDYVAGLIVLCMAGFITYLVLPVAPPWWAEQHGYLAATGGHPAILHLKDQGFDTMARALGFDGRYVYSYAIYDINPNEVAAFPSLHAAFPFLAFLFARRTFGRVGWLMLAYSVGVWFSIVYLGEHYVVDILGGLAYAAAAYWVVIHAPGWFRRVLDRAADREIEAGVEAEEAGDETALDRLGRRVRWSLVGQGGAVALAGVAGIVLVGGMGLAGGAGTPLYLVPWALLIAGAWRAGAGLLAR
jgi:membrane-associated phospholipid phosphatase